MTEMGECLDGGGGGEKGTNGADADDTAKRWGWGGMVGGEERRRVNLKIPIPKPKLIESYSFNTQCMIDL